MSSAPSGGYEVGRREGRRLSILEVALTVWMFAVVAFAVVANHPLLYAQIAKVTPLPETLHDQLVPYLRRPTVYQ
jgi:hypothetical protein